MESLPTEIIQQIAWFSLNPELYLVSKKVSSRLLPLRLFEEDVAALLFCRHRSTVYAQHGVKSFLWKTPQAATCTYILDRDERAELQLLVLNQAWIDQKKLRQIANRFYKQWIDRHWDSADMPAEDRKALADFMKSDILEKYRRFNGNNGKRLTNLGFGKMRIFQPSNISDSYVKQPFQVLCYPLKLFVPPRSWSKLDLFYLLTALMRRGRRNWFPVLYSSSALRKALFSIVLDEDEDWFLALFPLAMDGGVDIPRRQLVHELSSTALGGRKWKMMKLLSWGIRLPNDYMESTLAPAMAQAIKDGDIKAREFQQWIEYEGWDKIQSGNYYKRGWEFLGWTPQMFISSASWRTSLTLLSIKN